MLVAAIKDAYTHLFTPIAPLAPFGVSLTAFDVVAALRLCVLLRQAREAAVRAHLNKTGGDAKDVESPSYVKNIAVTLTTVYGGEAVLNPWLGLKPSFVFSPTVPALYTALTLFVELLPAVPQMSIFTELPLSLLDGLTRSVLLCSFVPPLVTTHAEPVIATSPWVLLLTSCIITNAGFFFVNLFSMLSPCGFGVSGTPPELRAAGWTSTDLWCAPLVTATYALLTHAQPAWAQLHAAVFELFSFSSFGGGGVGGVEKPIATEPEPLDADTARALCAIVLAVLFTTRTVRNFGGVGVGGAGAGGPKNKKAGKVVNGSANGIGNGVANGNANGNGNGHYAVGTPNGKRVKPAKVQ